MILLKTQNSTQYKLNKVNNLEKRISYATTLIHIINTIQINKI